MSVRSVARPISFARIDRVWILSALALVWLGCWSSGGARPTPPGPIACSVDEPCPDGFVCVLDRGLCSLADEDMRTSFDLTMSTSDMTMSSGDMTMSSGDMTMSSGDMTMPPVDMTMPPIDMAMPPVDMATPPIDMAMPPIDMATPPIDMATPPIDMAMPPIDMAMPPIDMAMPPRDMATPPDLTMPPRDLAMPPDMAMPPPGSEACPSPNWCWENPLPQGFDLNAVWGTSASDVWAVGQNGVALRWNGSTWKQIATGTTLALNGIWGRGASQVWVVGSSGTILYWDGTRFTSQTSGTTQNLYGVWGDSATVWAVGAVGTVQKRSGTTWSSVTIGTSSTLRAVWGSASNDIWTVGQDGMACHYGGASWSCGAEFPTTDVALTLTGFSKNNIWAFGTMRDAWQWNGTKWTSRSKPSAPGTILSSTALGSKVLAAGDQGTGLLFDGTTWTSLSLGGPAQLFSGAWAQTATNAYIVGERGAMLHFDGATLRPHSSGFGGSEITAMWGSSDRDVWVFTIDGLAHHSDGTRWTDTTLPSVGYSATGYGTSSVWVGSDAGRLMNYDGTRWTITTTRDTAAPIRGIYIAGVDRVALVSSSAVQFWDGTRFTVTLTPTWLPRAVWGTGPNDIWVAGTPGCPYARWNGATWTSGTVPGCTQGIAAIHGTSATNMYMVSDSPGASLYRWDGTKFTAITTGSTAAKTAVFTYSARTFVTTKAGEVLVGNSGTWTTSLSLPTALEHIAGFTADKVWVGGAGSRVLSYKP